MGGSQSWRCLCSLLDLLCFDPLLQFLCSRIHLLVFLYLDFILPLLLLSLLEFPLDGLVLSLLGVHVGCCPIPTLL